jgi:erythromycin esterase-like protein
MSTVTTLDRWIAREAIGFAIDSPRSFDPIVAALGDSVEVLGLGEPMHGAEEFLTLRNRIFARLVEAHGYTAIAVESSFPRGRIANDYVAAGTGTFDQVQEAGFSHGFGRHASNRALIEWMRQYNADPSHSTKIRFYGFDAPTEMMYADSPRQALHFVLDYLAEMDTERAKLHRQRIDDLLGEDAAWENTAAAMDPGKSVGLSPAATRLRIETENLIAHLSVNRPDWAKRDADRYEEALHYARLARQLLTYHAGMAGNAPTRIADLLGLRDAMMADNLTYALAREQSRGGGKILAFAHNSHLQRGQAKWQLGPHALAWWPAGAHVHSTLGQRYAVIGCGMAASDAHGLAPAEPGTLEARLTEGAAEWARFAPTHQGRGFAAQEIAALPTRSASTKNSTYFPLTAQSLSDFDGLMVLGSSGFST